MTSNSSRSTSLDLFLHLVCYLTIQSDFEVLTNTVDRWANELASDNGDSFKIQLPSDIKPGNYVLRTELIALHGNMKELKQGALKGEIQMYMHCFNLDIIGNGTVVPEGVTFPGAYKPNDAAFIFDPYMTYGTPDPVAAIVHNSRYVSSAFVNLTLWN
jgi:cellulase